MPHLDQLSSRGWELLRLSTDELRVDLVPELGASIVSIVRLSDDTELLWRTPWGLRTRGAARLLGDSEATFMDSYPGGWHTQFPNGGDAAMVDGVEWGFHGEARIAPFDWEFSEQKLILKSRLVRSPFEVTKIISLDGSSLSIEETVHNVGAEAVEVMWGQQLAFGAPLLAADTVFDSAASVIHPDPTVTPGADYDDVMPWPRTVSRGSMINLHTIPAPDSRETRMAYLSEFDAPTITISNQNLDLRVALDWDLEAWPHVWYSFESGGRTGFPWYTAGYFLALSPNSSWPARGVTDARRISQSTVWIRPGETRTAQLRIRIEHCR